MCRNQEQAGQGRREEVAHIYKLGTRFRGQKIGDTPDNLGTDSSTELSSVHVSNTVDALNRAVHCQRDALENLLSCYSTNEACTNKDFKRLRTWLTNSLFLYKDLHLPQTTQVVANLQTIFMMYEIMDVETFMEDIQSKILTGNATTVSFPLSTGKSTHCTLVCSALTSLVSNMQQLQRRSR